MISKSSPDNPGHKALMILEPCLIAHHLVKAWLDSGNHIAAIWSETRRPGFPKLSQYLVARASGVQPFGLLARMHGIPIRKIDRRSGTHFDPGEIELTGADTLITAMTMQIIPEAILQRFGERAVNFHPSLLPDYRGKCPRLSMLYDGAADECGGITLHRLSSKIDAGPIISQRPLPWSKTPDFALWNLAAAWATSEMVGEELMAYLAGEIHARPQCRGEGGYRKCRKEGFDISNNMDLATVRNLFDQTPGVVHLWKPPPEGRRKRALRVVSLQKTIGPLSGRPPRVTPFTIETDLADARVRLLRRNLSHLTVRHPVWSIRSAVRKRAIAHTPVVK